MENIKEIIETEEFNLQEAETTLKKLSGQWFKFGKKSLVDFLKIYIEDKKKFINKLKQHKQKLLSKT